jgi:hypothetical protein
MSLKPKPQSWDDVKPGDVITWTETKWSYRLGRNTERPRRMLVRVVGPHEPRRGDTIRVIQGVVVTKTDQPHKAMNKYPLTDADNVSTGEMGHAAVLPLGWITSLDRPAYALIEGGECPAGHIDIAITDGGTCATCEQTPAAKPVKLTDVQWSAINYVSGLDCRGYFSSYAIPTNTSAALVGKGLITHIIRIGGFGRQWLTPAGFKAAGIDLATLVEGAHAEALVENGLRICDEADADDAQIHVYARDVEVTGPEFPAGTPEYETYATELHTELEKFAKGEAPYEYGPIDKAAVLAKPIDSLLNSGAVEPQTTPRTLLELIDAHAQAVARGEYGRERAHVLRAQIERRLDALRAEGEGFDWIANVLDGRA